VEHVLSRLRGLVRDRDEWLVIHFRYASAGAEFEMVVQFLWYELERRGLGLEFEFESV
jgi:hypothetical protein